MGLKVVKPGILNTIQDRGRPGFSKWGVNPGGVMDRYASRVANALVGNPGDNGVLEMHFPAGEFVTTQPMLVSLTGADFGAQANGVRIPVWKPAFLPADSVLRFTAKLTGERCYLAVGGGFVADKWLNSCSTHLKLAAGGNRGRPLEKGDVVEISMPAAKRDATAPVILPWSVNPRSAYENSHEIRFVEGHEWGWMTPGSQSAFVTDTFVIDRLSDRMGYYMNHSPLQLATTSQLISAAVTMGTIQLMPSGKILTLMADHQTTGGYPRIAHVASVDLPKLAQLGAGSVVHFKKIEVDEAENMLISLGRHLQMVQQSCLENLKAYHAH